MYSNLYAVTLFAVSNAFGQVIIHVPDDAPTMQIPIEPSTVVSGPSFPGLFG